MTDAPATPSISIGLPVFNGERHLAAIATHLPRTCEDFERVVRDTASAAGSRNASIAPRA